MNPREILLKTYAHERTGYIPSNNAVDFCWPSILNEGRPKGYGRYTDAWGVVWNNIEGQPGSINDETAPKVLNDVTKWREQVHIPDPEELDWAAGAAADTAHWDRENKISNVILTCGIWERFYMLCGFQDALLNLAAEPEATYECLCAIADQRVQYIEKIAKYYKPDKIQVHDDYGIEKSLLFSRDTWLELIKPNLKKLVDACHRNGILYEHHSCGYIVPLLDDFIELGVDAWNTVQYANNPPALAEKYHGKFTLVGGLNDRLFVDPTATEEDLKASIRESISLAGKYGSWVLRPFPGMPAEWVDFLNREIDLYNQHVSKQE